MAILQSTLELAVWANLVLDVVDRLFLVVVRHRSRAGGRLDQGTRGGLVPGCGEGQEG